MSTVPENTLDSRRAGRTRSVDAESKTPPPGQQFQLPGASLQKYLFELGRKARSKQDLYKGIGNLIIGSGASALWVVTRNAQGQWQEPSPLVDETEEILEFIRPALEVSLEPLSKDGADGLIACQEISGLPNNVLLTAPVQDGGRVGEVLVTVAPRKMPTGVALDWILASVCQWLVHWQDEKHIRDGQVNLATVAGVLGITAALNRCNNRLETAITLVNEVKAVTRSQQVSLVFRSGSGGNDRLAAMSDLEHFDEQSESTRLAESLVAGLEGEAVFWQQDADESSIVAAGVNVAKLSVWGSQFGNGGIGLLPLRDRNNEIFAWLILGFAGSAVITPEFQKRLVKLADLLAGQVEMVLKTQRSLFRIAIDHSQRWLAGRWARLLGVVGLATLILMCLPFAYQIPCDCQLQLTRRRFVAAPYEGLLEKTLAESGDVVKSGDVLARMDGRKLRMELAALNARVGSERKRRDSALAKGNVAESQIASSELSRLEFEINILNSRLENTEIRSPLDGVVVSGDLDKAEGVPMEMGQTLFEVGPLEQLLVEIHIPESEIRFAEKGMKVELEFDSFPFQSFSGTLQRIHPRAEIVESDNVFVAEFEMDNPDGQLRPGMAGRARIRGHRYPLGWNLFHHALDGARRWLFW